MEHLKTILGSVYLLMKGLQHSLRDYQEVFKFTKLNNERLTQIEKMRPILHNNANLRQNIQSITGAILEGLIKNDANGIVQHQESVSLSLASKYKNNFIVGKLISFVDTEILEIAICYKNYWIIDFLQSCSFDFTRALPPEQCLTLEILEKFKSYSFKTIFIRYYIRTQNFLGAIYRTLDGKSTIYVDLPDIYYENGRQNMWKSVPVNSL